MWLHSLCFVLVCEKNCFFFIHAIYFNYNVEEKEEFSVSWIWQRWQWQWKRLGWGNTLLRNGNMYCGTLWHWLRYRQDFTLAISTLVPSRLSQYLRLNWKIGPLAIIAVFATQKLEQMLEKKHYYEEFNCGTVKIFMCGACSWTCSIIILLLIQLMTSSNAPIVQFYRIYNHRIVVT